MNNPFLLFSTAKASPDTRTNIFLGFIFLSTVADLFIGNALKFVLFELTQSKSTVSLIGSVSATAFITFGLVSGIVVDATSRRFFVIFHLIVFSILSMIVFIFYENNLVSAALLFGFIFIRAISSTTHGAAKNVVFFDLCGTAELSRWISHRNIIYIVSGVVATFLLTYFVGDEAFLFMIYSVLLMMAYGTFISIGYKDQNIRQRFSSPGDAARFVRDRFVDFIAICLKHRTLRMLFLFSFMKTFFIFWPMTSGVLFKFGIEEDATRRIYLMVMIFMDFVSMATFHLLGRKQSFSNRSFIIGAAMSGLGILLFALVESIVLSAATLAIMYVGLAISGASSSYILRMELPEEHRTQGLSFSVVPYYLADIFSGVVFASLLTLFSVKTLLIGAGSGLILVCILVIQLVKKSSHI